MRVFVYWNLHRGLWSVKALEGERKGRVIARMPCLCLIGASFSVSEAGRQRVLREGRKNVHAGVVGHLCVEEDGTPMMENTMVWSPEGFTHGAAVTYNPRTGPDFYLRSAGPLLGSVRKAGLVNFFPDRRVLAAGLTA